MSRQRSAGRKINARLSPIDGDRLDQLVEMHGDSESNIIRDALLLKWYVDIGFDNLLNLDLLKREANTLTNYGTDDPAEGG